MFKLNHNRILFLLNLMFLMLENIAKVFYLFLQWFPVMPFNWLDLLILILCQIFDSDTWIVIEKEQSIADRKFLEVLGFHVIIHPQFMDILFGIEKVPLKNFIFFMAVRVDKSIMEELESLFRVVGRSVLTNQQYCIYKIINFNALQLW